MTLDRDDIAQAMYDACGADVPTGYSIDKPVTPDDRAVAAFRNKLRRFLAELPGFMTVEELRTLMERSEHDGE